MIAELFSSFPVDFQTLILLLANLGSLIPFVRDIRLGGVFVALTNFALFVWFGSIGYNTVAPESLTIIGFVIAFIAFFLVK